MHLIFTSLAFNQTRYFVALCEELKGKGFSSSIISFHEQSNSFIETRGVQYFNVFAAGEKHQVKMDLVPDAFVATMRDFGVEAPNILLSHEKTAFNITNDLQLKRKFIKYFKVVDEVLKKAKSEYGSNLVVVQELGGFASLLATFFVSRKLGIEHLFLEPSFFKGRMFIVRNSLLAHKPIGQNGELSPEVEAYLKKVRVRKEIVIPQKDRLHYQHPIFKIMSATNFKRLAQKLGGKYVWGSREEFNYIGSFVLRHVRMLVNRFRLSMFYKSIPDCKFIYYPFHVPMDVALTIRAPRYLDQYSLIDYISRSLPADYQLVIKEHPAMIGVVSYNRVRDLLRRNQNIVLLNPDINNYEVIARADLLITVNSKTGAESLMMGKRVVCLGDAFYAQAKPIRYLDNIHNLFREIKEGLEANPPEASTVGSFFQAVWDESFPGELYFCEEQNIKNSAESVSRCLNRL